MLSATATAPPTHTEAEEGHRPGPPGTRGLDRTPRRPPRAPVEFAAGEDPNVAMLRDEVRQQVLDEIEQERAVRHQQRSDHHLDRLLDEVSGFAEEYELDERAQAALESSMVRMHERLEELRPAGPPEPGGPPPEAMDALERAFDTFRVEVNEALDNADLADAFTEQMTPRPLRDRERFRD